MNDEINKIIQSISDFYKLDNALKYYLDRHKAQILLDYITNLQQENQKLKEKMMQQIKTCKRKTMDDEFFTMYKDCVRELHKYDLRGKKIICPCDNKNSNIYKYLKDCYCNVKCDDKEWRNIDYSKYDLVITNPPFSQVREFIRYLIDQKIDFIIIVSDVLRYSIAKGKTNFDIKLYKGWDAQKFYRPDGNIKAIHCGWISTLQDDYNENKLLNILQNGSEK